MIWKFLAREVVIFISENTCAGSRPDQVPDQILDLASEIEEVVALLGRLGRFQGNVQGCVVWFECEAEAEFCFGMLGHRKFVLENELQLKMRSDISCPDAVVHGCAFGWFASKRRGSRGERLHFGIAMSRSSLCLSTVDIVRRNSRGG